jgi:two-component system cell cycle response regulator
MAPTIIVVEDHPDISFMLTRQLRREGYTVREASTIAAARELTRDPWDLAILDRTLPDGDGVELCRELRASAPHCYLLMFTGSSSDEAKMEGFASGADDYVTKATPIHELMARVRAGVRIVDLQKRLLELSQTDALTSLRNRRAFDERLEQAFRHATRYERPLSLAILDVDHFKSVNDESGHDIGDAVLRGVANVLGRHIRQTDFAARVGGEEFAILLPETPLFEALQFGEKIRAAIACAPIADRAVTVSIGIANVPHSPVSGPTGFFRAADQALYRAKENGRNRVELERRRACRKPGQPSIAPTAQAST